MARELKKSDLEALLPKDADLRPMIAEQVRKFIASNDHNYPPDSDIAKTERFLRSVEQKGYARKIRKRDTQPNENSAPYEAMLKNWGRKCPNTGQPAPEGDKNFARGVFYFFLRDVANHTYFTAVAAQVWPPDDLTFQRLYYAKYFDDPKTPNFTNVSSRYRAETEVIRKEFRKIWFSSPVGLPTKVRLGPVTIVLGDEINLNRLSLQEPINPTYITDGMPDVFKALDWRSCLSGFYGRAQDVTRLSIWAQDGTPSLKVMLLSGYGGAGKSRLAAFVVSDLVHRHGWCGGLLGDANSPIDGNGTGVALIIDYPEERTRLVADILKAVAQSLKNGEQYDRPIRIILVSREDLKAWESILNEPVTFMEEIRLDARPYLDISDALAIVEDIAIEYPKHLGKSACSFSGVEAWLATPVHRLPLNVVAASVHAVLDPSRAFKLDGMSILKALAKWELRRVRYYSKRDLGDLNALEILIGLSVFTQFGLIKETVFKLGEKQICPRMTGDSLLTSVRKTPYWRPRDDDRPSHLVRLEPDRPAAAFCLEALRLDDASPGLPMWLLPTISQDADGFGDRLSRLAFDIGHVDAEASQRLEKQCVAMLDLQPKAVDKFRNIAYKYSPVFSAEFAIDVCNRVLADPVKTDDTIAIKNNLANMLSDLGDHEVALKVINDALSTYQALMEVQNNNSTSELALLLNNKSCILHELKQSEAALSVIDSAIAVHYKSININSAIFKDRLAMMLSNKGNRLSDLGNHEDALQAVEQAIVIRRELAETRTENALHGLAGSLNNQANRLFNLGRFEVALKNLDEAVQIYEKISSARPDLFLQNLAMSLHNQSSTLLSLKRDVDAFKAINRTVLILCKLAKARPKVFLAKLAESLHIQTSILINHNRHRVAINYIFNAISETQKQKTFIDFFASSLADYLDNYAVFLSTNGKFKPALEVADAAVLIRRQLVRSSTIDAWDKLAKSLHNLANRLSDLGYHEVAQNATGEEVHIYTNLARVQSDFKPNLANALANQADTLCHLGQNQAALEAAEAAVLVFSQLDAVNYSIFRLDFARALSNLADILCNCENFGAALKVAKSASSMFRECYDVENDSAVIGLSISLHTEANIMFRLKMNEPALVASVDAISTLKPEFFKHPATNKMAIDTMINLYIVICINNGSEQDIELLKPILDILETIR